MGNAMSPVPASDGLDPCCRLTPFLRPADPIDAHATVAGCPRSLQTGMRGAYGKPQGKVARVSIGDPIISIRVNDKHEKFVVEGLRRYVLCHETGAALLPTVKPSRGRTA